ncbi:hypothetical protein [Variovorax defluvii]|uniref:hypothetical protein n=1 Tax=Variovorax defluvii TaxID=913761 RepID=UPI0031E5555A
MGYLTEADLRLWLDAATHLPQSLDDFLPWLEGPVRKFFPYRGLVFGHGELVAGQLKVTHMLATGHEEAYLKQLATTFELEHRGSLKWWFATRQPFCIDPVSPPTHTSAFELEEIKKFGLRNVAGHGVLNLKANGGTYFGFSGVKEPISGIALGGIEVDGACTQRSTAHASGSFSAEDHLSRWIDDGDGADCLHGQTGADTLTGGAGNENLFGGGQPGDDCAVSRFGVPCTSAIVSLPDRREVDGAQFGRVR